MNRRQFFAALLAPLLALFGIKLKPKPDPWWMTPKLSTVFLKSRQFGMSAMPQFQFGFTGFKDSQAEIDTAGRFLIGSNIMGPPRRCFKLEGLF